MILLITFLVFFTLLALIYLYFCLSPKKLTSIENLYLKENRAVYEEQAILLQDQLNKKEIDESVYQKNLVALQRELLTNTPDEPLLHAHDAPWTKVLTFLIVFTFPIAAALVYWHQGSIQQYQKFEQAIQQKEEANKALKELGSPDQVIAKLKEKLTSTPQDARGWYLLGRIYFSQQRFKEATHAFEKANLLKPHQIEILTPLAESLTLIKQTDKANSVLKEVLSLAPNDPNTINLEALIAYQNKDYQQAITLWQQLLAEAPADSDAAKSISTAIEDATRHLSKHNSTKTLLSPLLKIKVNVSENLKQKLQAQDVLFVYAKAASGPAMPLAILRLDVSAPWPKVVELSDQQSMAGLKLSEYQDVIVYARISHSGQAMPQAGDFIGNSKIIHLEKQPQPVNVLISDIA